MTYIARIRNNLALNRTVQLYLRRLPTSGYAGHCGGDVKKNVTKGVSGNNPDGWFWCWWNIPESFFWITSG